MQNKSQTVNKSVVSFFGSLIGASASLAGLAFHAGFGILFGFFLVQICVKALVLHSEGKYLSAGEKLFIGPLKVAVSLLMITTGIPTGEQNFLGLLWIGIALLFFASGFKNVYSVMRAGTTPAPRVPVTTVRQREKALKEDERLLADLGSFLGDDFTDRK